MAGDTTEASEGEEEGEWEYEYSATETETYYLTLDLPCADFKERPNRGLHHSRGGFHKAWLEPIKGKDGDESAGAKQSRELDDVAMGDGDDGDDDDDDDDDDDALPLDPRLRSKGKGVDTAAAAAEEEEKEEEEEQEGQREDEVQILELHSDKPIIGYRGRLFEGQWAEVMGTELLLGRRDKKRPLAALRRLEGDVDILAASSSRILTREVVAQARQAEEDRLAAARERWQIRIPRPAGKDPTGERAEQLRFLENLMAVKRIKGQSDAVTVYARDGPGKDWDDGQRPDYRPRRRRAAAADEGQQPGRADRGRGRRAPRRRGRGTGAGAQLSRPTPRRWDDLGGAAAEEGDVAMTGTGAGA